MKKTVDEFFAVVRDQLTRYQQTQLLDILDSEIMCSHLQQKLAFHLGVHEMAEAIEDPED